MSKGFEVHLTPLDELVVLQRFPRQDNRGFLDRMFCEQELNSLLKNRHLVQINQSQSIQRGVLRGMHFQHPPYAEMKLVSCLHGEIFDVAVDLRKGSSTYLQWYGEILSEKNFKTMVIPEGFAHGFQVLSDQCSLIYFHTNFYNKNFEDGLSPFDEKLSISWPLTPPIFSERDGSFPKLKDRSVRVYL